MATEDELGWEYFGGDPDHSARMQEHMDWHMAPENQARTGNYGERFLDFHRDYIQKFDSFRMTKGLLPVTGWDPATPIPVDLAHPHVLMSGRATSNPASSNPACITPTWATLAGGTQMDPLHGYTRLGQFQSLDELGRSIDSGWHGTVHNTIGGDMASFMSPIDPVFWRWHKWIDNVRAAWMRSRIFINIPEILALIRILFGGVNDAPGLGLGPDGKPVPIPGGPGDPVIFTLDHSVRDLILAKLVREVATGFRSEALRTQAGTLATAAMKSAQKAMSAESR